MSEIAEERSVAGAGQRGGENVDDMSGGLVAARRLPTRGRHHEALEAVMNHINTYRRKTLHNPFV
eukprot:scaffold3079_cov174-Amphora_coffeaeformis.AAC.20